MRDVLPGEVFTISPEKGIESDMTVALPKEKARLEELLAKAKDASGAFNDAPDGQKARALVQLSAGFAALYREWQTLDTAAQTDDQRRQAGDALAALEELNRRAHEACSFTPSPLAQLAVLQSAA